MEYIRAPREMRVGLRFMRKDAKLLYELAARVRVMDLGGADKAQSVEVFAAAARAAAVGEPMVVVAANEVEVQMMAAGYTQYGVSMPAIEALSGKG